MRLCAHGVFGAQDKRNVYDWNTRIHLLARGPGIAKGMQWSQPATQVDMGPTFLGLAGVSKPSQMDGKSIVPFLVKERRSDDELPASTRNHLAELGDQDAYTLAWRDSVGFGWCQLLEGCSGVGGRWQRAR